MRFRNACDNYPCYPEHARVQQSANKPIASLLVVNIEV